MPLPEIERQIEAHLTRFALPPGTAAEVIRVYADAHRRQSDVKAKKREIEARLDRIRELYTWGDMARDDYQSQRDRLTEELGSLRAEQDFEGVPASAAELLRDLPRAWNAAPAGQRNDLAGLVFEAVEIKDAAVQAFAVRGQFVPFFAQALNDDTAGIPGGVNPQLDEAEATGFEPAISALTGLHVRPLHHASERGEEDTTAPRSRQPDR